MQIHHLTHIDNLENILKQGLAARNFLNNNSIYFTDTANHDIIDKRNELNNYIPFHSDFIQYKYEIIF